ncbi:rhodanese-like domain-containing protein [Aestuariirhabdus litorea]|uniref:Rhodanese-like domain-containing protein n=1 Tax=Aestuariirhabdus litorea TaxID=2528527 RepID=A0A3P3VNU9_9GAMM|nr:rhodanese-like domain-containing protein [Aestuariirhabdus litorea]RRJ84094.1 rhodanese-like domain-containing protein [Aestuariirhabdus litorea]RWW97314.1 rhodanese-like domain-containing protein [Endozoicomonadaceae bacterium GTF-13]
MKKLFSGLLMAVAMVFSNGVMAEGEQPATIPGAKTVTAEELIALVDDLDNLVIIDARSQSDYDKGHIPDVVRIKNDDVTPEKLAEAIDSKDSPVAFYCNSITCPRSADAASKAYAAGYTNIYWFRGGIAEWREKGYPVEM